MSSEAPLWFCHEVSRVMFKDATMTKPYIPVSCGDETNDGQYNRLNGKAISLNLSVGSRSSMLLVSWGIRWEGKPHSLHIATSYLTITIRWKTSQMTHDSLLMTTSVLETICRLAWMLFYVCHWLWIINEFILTAHAFLAVSLQSMMDRGMRQNTQTPTRSTTGPSVISGHLPNRNKFSDIWLRWHLSWEDQISEERLMSVDRTCRTERGQILLELCHPCLREWYNIPHL